jgi:Transglutaminase-like superfamily
MKNWSRQFKIFLDLSIQEKNLFFKVFLYIIIIKFGLWVLPFRYFKKIYQTLLRQPVSPFFLVHIDIKMLVWSVEAIAANLPLGITCLPKALVTKFLLRADNNTLLKIGINFEKKILKAHAWVEKEGSFVIGNYPTIGYTPIWTW